MQYLIGMLSTFVALFLLVWMNNRKKGVSMDQLYAHWEKSHVQAARQADALEQISAILQNGR